MIWVIWGKADSISLYLSPDKRDNVLLSSKITNIFCLLTNETKIMLYNRKRLCKIQKVPAIYILNYKFKKYFLHIHVYTVLFISNNNVELMVWKIL